MAERKTGAQMDSGVSAADLSGKNRCFAKRTANGLNVAGAGEAVAGIIIEGKAAGLHTSIATGNQVQVISGEALPIDTPVTPDANGHAVAAAAGDEIAGRVIRASGAAGELATIEIDRTAADIA